MFMQPPECRCICRAINRFESVTSTVLERRGLGQDVAGCVFSYVCLVDRFPNHRPYLPQALSCCSTHDMTPILKKFNIWGNADAMMSLFSLCLQQANDRSAGRLLPFLGGLLAPSTLLLEACKYGCSGVVEQIVQMFGAVSCVRQLGDFSIGCDCFQSALLSKAGEQEKAKIVSVLLHCKDVEPHIIRSAFNTALRLRLRIVCDLLLLHDVRCVCPLSVAEAMVLCGERSLSVLIAHLPHLDMSPPEIYEVTCTAVVACQSEATIFLLLQAVQSMHVDESSHGTIIEWNLLRLAVCSCNMAAVSVIYMWTAVGGDVNLDSSVLHSVVASGKGEHARATVEWLLSSHLSVFSQLDMLLAAEAAAFSCNMQLLKLLLPHVPQTHNLRVVCEQQQQQQPAALMWLAMQGVK